MAIPKIHCNWKLAPSAEKGALLGYKNNNTLKRILQLQDEKVALNKHSTFDETSFPSLNQEFPLTNTTTTTNKKHFTVGKTNSTTMVEEAHEFDNQNPPYSAASYIWQKTIDKKLEAMEKLRVWEVMGLEDNHKLIGTTWVVKMKQSPLKGNKEYKACLCAQGFTQMPVIDYKKSYTLTGTLNSLQTLISFVAENLQFHKIDVKSTFLKAPSTEVVYLRIP
ncbi:hypothetical protein O181_060862 [Austropuccinia psidii MF-1]|uniref:Reverse transcriptase Ty1/copia-type domain-containing protein n=1 Tax=Austropuccinia psidii MF-1 TaxID=1389203 RepID=A0A9Q3EPC5_9BASI|nr:hypothetical protein [Austropuccinia psidii MF-1]